MASLPSIRARVEKLPGFVETGTIYYGSASDGSVLRAGINGNGQISSIEGTGVDGIPRSLTIERGAVSSFGRGRFISSSALVYQENGRRYLTLKWTVISSVRFPLCVIMEVSNCPSGNFLDTGDKYKFVSYDIDLVTGTTRVLWIRPGKGVINWNEAIDVSAPDLNLDRPLPPDVEPLRPSLEQAFDDEIARADYFSPFVEDIYKDYRISVQSQLDDVGLVLGSLSTKELVALPDAFNSWKGSTGMGVSEINQAISWKWAQFWKAVVWGVAGAAGVAAGGAGAVVIGAAFFLGYDASMVGSFIDYFTTPVSSDSSGNSPASPTGNEGDTPAFQPKKKEEE